MSPAAPARTSPLSNLSRYLASYPAGARIYAEGEIATEMFVIRSGEVEITQKRKGETFTLARLSKGDFFGEASLLEGLPRQATARARTEVEVIRVNGAVFEEMVRSNPDIALRMLRRLSRQARQATAYLEEISGVRQTPAGGIAVEASEEPEDIPDPVADVPQLSEERPRPAEGSPQLVSQDRKTRFPVHAEGDTIVGRADPQTGICPDVDLTSFDVQRTVSRRHARLYRIGETMYVMEEIGVVNGTFVNDLKLATGTPAALHHGDDLKLGFVTLTFWHPTA